MNIKTCIDLTRKVVKGSTIPTIKPALQNYRNNFLISKGNNSYLFHVACQFVIMVHVQHSLKFPDSFVFHYLISDITSVFFFGKIIYVFLRYYIGLLANPWYTNVYVSLGPVNCLFYSLL